MTIAEQLLVAGPSSQAALDAQALAALPGDLPVLVRYRPNSGAEWEVWRTLEPVVGLVRMSGPGVEWTGSPQVAAQVLEVRLPRLPRLSCAMTVVAVRHRQKDITRRLALPTWCQVGRLVLLVDKIRAAGANGLAVVEVVAIRREELGAIESEDVQREGMPAGVGPGHFVQLFCQAQKGVTPATAVWRIEWRYV